MPKKLPKIVVDTATLISLVHGNILELALSEFEFLISNWIIEELNNTAKYKDIDAEAARAVLKQKKRLKIIRIKKAELEKFLSRRIDLGEASCIAIAGKEKVDTLISDDFKAIPELKYWSKKFGFDLGLCAILIKALVLKGKLNKEKAKKIFDRIGRKRGWIGRPIYDYGKKIL